MQLYLHPLQNCLPGSACIILPPVQCCCLEEQQKKAALPIPYTIYEYLGIGLSLSLSTLYSQNVDEQPSLQKCLMWNAHERRSEKYSQSTRMLTNFKTVCGVPGANIHSLATCFHVIVGRPPNYSKIIHRHTYNPL
jgi:hypothetical protein